MFKNTLTGLSKREKEVFDAVCVHLNGCMRRMGLTQLDGCEDQLLIDLWVDMYPYKVDGDGNQVYRTVKKSVTVVEPIYEKQLKRVKDSETGEYVMKYVDVVVGGRKVERVVEEQIRERDFDHSCVNTTSIGIYKWRAEQLFINKCKYLFGDRRTRVMSEGKAVSKEVVDAWGNTRVHAVYEKEVDPKKVSKRNLMMQVNECDLSPDGSDPISLADIAGTVDGGYKEIELFSDLENLCSDVELDVVKSLLEGYSAHKIRSDLKEGGVNFSSRDMVKLKDKLLRYLKPELFTAKA